MEELVEIHPGCMSNLRMNRRDSNDDDEITHNRDLDSDDIILYTVDCLEER